MNQKFLILLISGFTFASFQEGKGSKMSWICWSADKEDELKSV